MAVFFSITVILPWLPVLLPNGIRARSSNVKTQQYPRTQWRWWWDHDDTREYVFYAYVADDRFRRINNSTPDGRADSPSDGFELKYRVPFVYGGGYAYALSHEQLSYDCVARPSLMTL